MSEIVKDQVFSVIKQVLKLRGLTYGTLAKALNMSESGVKKIFQEKNCSLEKLLLICSKLDIEIGELFELAEKPLFNKHLSLPQEIENEFLKNPRLFYLLRYIQTKTYSREWLYNKGFLDDDFEKLKSLLVKHDLLKPTDGVFSLRGSCLRFRSSSQLRSRIMEKYGTHLFKNAFKEKKRASLEPIFWAQAISKTDEDNIYREITELLEKYTKRSTLYREHLSEEDHELSYFIIPARFTPGSDEVDDIDKF